MTRYRLLMLYGRYWFAGFYWLVSVRPRFIHIRLNQYAGMHMTGNKPVKPVGSKSSFRNNGLGHWFNQIETSMKP
jgi:hypothetical protein